MIGNTITYRHWEWTSKHEFKPEVRQGIIVDAFTNITGKVKGETAFGFGDVKGDTKSDRTYRVLFYKSWDNEKKFPEFNDITISQVIQIVQLANTPTESDEKIVVK